MKKQTLKSPLFLSVFIILLFGIYCHGSKKIELTELDCVGVWDKEKNAWSFNVNVTGEYFIIGGKEKIRKVIIGKYNTINDYKRDTNKKWDGMIYRVKTTGVDRIPVLIFIKELDLTMPNNV